MKISDTKIYLRFIGWFVFVSIVPLLTFFISAYFLDPNNTIFIDSGVRRQIIFGLLFALAVVLGLSLIATKLLSKTIINSVSLSIFDLERVLNSIFKSIENLSQISKNNQEIAKFLINTSQSQQKGLRLGTTSVNDMVQALNQINSQTAAAAKKANEIDKLGITGSQKSNLALDGLMSLKNLASQSQMLGQALYDYTKKVSEAAERVQVLADTAKFLSLNASIEASKKSFPAEFSGIIAQVRELNMASHEVAVNIHGLSEEMNRQIEQAKRSSVYEWEETNKGINVISDTLNLFNKIVKNVGGISQSARDINISTANTLGQAGEMNTMIVGLGNEAKSLVRQTQEIGKVIEKQFLVTRALDKSSKTLKTVAQTLQNLVNNNGQK